MPHATPYAGKSLTINGKNLFIGWFKWPIMDEGEQYFAALELINDDGSWTTLLQLDPMPIATPIKGAEATMNDILAAFNAKVLESVGMVHGSGSVIHESDTWNQRMKKLFDNLVLVDGKIVIGS